MGGHLHRSLRRSGGPSLEGPLLGVEYRLVNLPHAAPLLPRKGPAHGGEHRLDIHILLHGGGERLVEGCHLGWQQQLRRHQRHKNAPAGHQAQHQPQVLCRQGLALPGSVPDAPGPPPCTRGDPPPRLP